LGAPDVVYLIYCHSCEGLISGNLCALD